MTPKLSPRKTAYLLAAANFFTAMAMDIYLPSLPDMSENLQATEFQVQMVLVVFYLGAMFSRMLWGPLSEMFGRRNSLVAALIIQCLTQLGCVLSTTAEALIFFRAFQSLGSGITSVISIAMVADLFQREQRARMIGLIELSFTVAFVAGPIVGSFLVPLGWRAGFIFILIAFTLTLILFWYFLPETHPQEKGRAAKKYFYDYGKLLKNGLFMLYSSLPGLFAGNLMIFVIHSPFIYMEDFGYSNFGYMLFQIPPMIFGGLAILWYRRIVLKLGVYRCLNLSYMMFAIFGLAVLLLLLEVVPAKPLIIVSYICFLSFIVSFSLPGATARALDLFPEIKGTSSSVVASLRGALMGICMLLSSYYAGDDIYSTFKGLAICTGFILIYRMFARIVGRWHTYHFGDHNKEHSLHHEAPDDRRT